MKISLGKFAEVRTGLFVRPEPEGDLVYLQAKHFDESGNLCVPPTPEVMLNNTARKHLLPPGCVLFSAKGTKNFATLHRGEFPAVASTTFLVITIRNAIILPEYLSWLLNSPGTQLLLKRNATGSSIVSITKRMLQELEIAVPPIERQRQILEISRLSKIENEIRLRIARLRQFTIEKQIGSLIR